MIFFLYGEDTYRSREKLKKIKDKFLHDIDPGGSSLIVVDGETATMEKINEAAGAPSLFTKRRMIVIERILINKNKILFDQILTYLKNVNSADVTRKKEAEQPKTHKNILVFWDDITGEGLATNKLFQFLIKQQYTQQFKLLSNTEAVDWMKKEVKARGARIQHQAALSLTSLLGSNLWQLSHEINKAIAFIIVQ